MFRKQAEKDGKTKTKAKNKNKNRISPGRMGTGKNGGNEKDLKGLVAKLKPYSHVLVWAAITFVVVFAIFLISLVPPQVELRAGEVSTIDVKATKEVIDEAATEKLRAESVAAVSEVYDSNPRVLDEIEGRFEEFAQKIKELASTEEDLSTQDIVNELRPYVDDSVSDTDIIGVVATSPEIVGRCINRAGEVVEEILLRGLKSENLENGKEEASAKIVIDKSIPDQVARVLAGFVEKNLEANLTLNKEETDKKIKQAIASVEPVKIRRDEYIVRKGDIVTENQIVLLQKLGIMGARVRFSQISGAFLMALLFCGFTGVYTALYYGHMLNHGNTALLASVIMLSMIALKALAGVSGFLAPVSFGVMLSATLIDRRFGAFLGSSLALAVGVMTGFQVKYVAVALTSGIASSLAVRKVWNRAQLFQASLVVMAVSGATYTCLGLTGAMAMDDVSLWRKYYSYWPTGRFQLFWQWVRFQCLKVYLG